LQSIYTSRTIHYLQYTSGHRVTVTSDIIVEAPMTLTVNGDAWLTFMCTPNDLDALAAGFLCNEGVIHSKNEIASLRVCPTGDNIDIWLDHSVDKPEYWRRTSGCTGGITAADQIINNNVNLKEAYLTPTDIFELISLLLNIQSLYHKTGGIHTSALSDGKRLSVIAEDIGRHNTLDKIAGRCLLDDISPERMILLTTGRVSSEMIQKSAQMGASIVISRTSPTSLSIKMADQWGLTLIGYARRDSFRLYSHPERIIHTNQSEDFVKEP